MWAARMFPTVFIMQIYVTWVPVIVVSQKGFNFEEGIKPRRYGAQYACDEGSFSDGGFLGVTLTF